MSFTPYLLSFLTVLTLVSQSRGFVFCPPNKFANKFAQTPFTTATSLAFGIPKFLDPNNNKDDDGDEPKKLKEKLPAPKEGIGLSGIVQLITAGAGSPFLGDYKGVDEETGNFMFELEANNLTDEEGNSKQTQAKYFEEGWVDEDAEPFRFPWQKKQ
mmetsp:Transcript_15159/g.30176  ORF Transcript_15159/g.30176 Transcript_15159/m.30176 type:complete len:157 (-) Transcript_15159:71-541(-)